MQKTLFPNSSPADLKIVLVAAYLILSAPTMAQVAQQDLLLPIDLVADSTDYDGKNSMLMFKGLRLSQGNLGVEADEGRATKLDFEDGVWSFAGNVVIDTENGHIACDTADLQFHDLQLQTATITGTPATFELKRPGSDQVTYAEAGRLQYDFTSGTIEFLDDATITEDGNQIASNYLVYNIAEQRISAKAAGADGDKVKMTYTPKSLDVIDAAVDDTATDEIDDLQDSIDSPAPTLEPDAAGELPLPNDSTYLPENEPAGDAATDVDGELPQ